MESLPEDFGDLNLEELAHALQGVITGLFVAQTTTIPPTKKGFRDITRRACRKWIELLR